MADTDTTTAPAETEDAAPKQPAAPKVDVHIKGTSGNWAATVKIDGKSHSGSFEAYDRAERFCRRTLAENGIG